MVCRDKLVLAITRHHCALNVVADWMKQVVVVCAGMFHLRKCF